MRTPLFLPALCLAAALVLDGDAEAATIGLTSLPGRYPAANFLLQTTPSPLSQPSTSGATLMVASGTAATNGTLNSGAGLIRTGAGTVQLQTSAINLAASGWIQSPATYNAVLGPGASTTNITLTNPIILWNTVNTMTRPIHTGTLTLSGTTTYSGTLTINGSGRLILGQTAAVPNSGALINTAATLTTNAANFTLTGAAVHALSPNGNNFLTIQRSRDLENTLVLAAPNSEPSPVPEPSTGVLVLAGLAMILGRRSRR